MINAIFLRVGTLVYQMITKHGKKLILTVKNGLAAIPIRRIEHIKQDTLRLRNFLIVVCIWSFITLSFMVQLIEKSTKTHAIASMDMDLKDCYLLLIHKIVV